MGGRGTAGSPQKLSGRFTFLDFASPTALKTRAVTEREIETHPITSPTILNNLPFISTSLLSEKPTRRWRRAVAAGISIPYFCPAYKYQKLLATGQSYPLFRASQSLNDSSLTGCGYTARAAPQAPRGASYPRGRSGGCCGTCWRSLSAPPPAARPAPRPGRRFWR